MYGSCFLLINDESFLGGAYHEFIRVLCTRKGTNKELCWYIIFTDHIIAIIFIVGRKCDCAADMCRASRRLKLTAFYIETKALNNTEK